MGREFCKCFLGKREGRLGSAGHFFLVVALCNGCLEVELVG